MIYPWQEATWQRLTEAFLQNKLPHALLFSGVADIGKSLLVTSFVRFILCGQRVATGLFCSTTIRCHTCHLVEKNIHPNMHYVRPTEIGHPIKIDQIRDLIEFAAHSATLGTHQCIVINPAQQMNIFAANSLLKILEEPMPNVFLFLITRERNRLPATIVSRTIHVRMPVPARDAALAWLQQQVKKPLNQIELSWNLASGAPLNALALLTSQGFHARELVYEALQTIQSQPESFMHNVHLLQEIDPTLLFNLVLSWAMDIAKIKCGVIMAQIKNQDYAEALKLAADYFSQQEIEHLLRRLTLMHHDFTKGVNLNKSLLIENILMSFMRNNHVFS